MRSSSASSSRRFASRWRQRSFAPAQDAATASWIQSGGRSKSGSLASFLRREGSRDHQGAGCGESLRHGRGDPHPAAQKLENNQLHLEARRRRKMRREMKSLSTLLAACALLAGCASNPITGRSQLDDRAREPGAERVGGGLRRR